MSRFAMLRLQWDRASGVALTGLGLLVLLVGYVRISNTPYPAEQLPLLLSGGLGALFLLGLGGTLWLSADLRDEWTKLDQLEQLQRQSLGDGPTTPAVPNAEADAHAEARSRPPGASADAPRNRRSRAASRPTAAGAVQGRRKGPGLS